MTRGFLNPKKRTSAARLADSMLLLGLGVAFVYWVVASLIFALTSENGTFIHQFFNPGLNEVLSRLLVLCFFMIFGSHVGYTIRQRQKADEALAGSEEKHRTIIENIEDGYFEMDSTGQFTIFNESFRKITGYEAEQLHQLDYRRLLTPAETEKVLGSFDKVTRTGRAIKDLGFVIVRKDGARRWVETSVSPIAGTHGQPDGYRGILRDVTRRRQADALKQEKMAAEAASRSKSEFLANMSHEIRTPLNAIIGLVELLLGSSLSREQQEDLKVVQSAAYALLSVINDILDFSKIEAGKLELERSPFNLRDFLGEALKILAVKAHEKNLELAYRVAPDVPDRLVGDPSPVPSGAPQPDRQRTQIHRFRGNYRLCPMPVPGRQSADAACGGERHRGGNSHWQAGIDFRGIPASRRQHHSKIRRHGSRAGCIRATGQPDGRADWCQKRTGKGQYFSFHNCLRCGIQGSGWRRGAG